MNSEFPFFIYYLGLLIATIFLSRFLFGKYIQFAKIYNIKKSTNEVDVRKGIVFTGSGVLYAAVIMVAALILHNMDFVEFSYFSPVIATSILASTLGFYNDLIKVTTFSKYITLSFLILILLYSNTTLPVIQNLNGFLGLNNIGFVPGIIFTVFIYLLIINVINLINRLDGYLAIYSISFFISLLYIFDINQFYTFNSISVIIIGCSVVFLNYNFSKREKKLYLGYSGSLFIGFWIVTFLIKYINSAPSSRLVDTYSINIDNIPVIAISMISIPILDSLRIILLKIITKKSSFVAHKNHLYHILLALGMSNLRTSLFLTFINWFNCIIIFLIEPNFNSYELTLIYIGISLFWFIFFEYLNKKNISS